MIASEYCLTDDQILDLTLDRVAQMVRTINRRLNRRFEQTVKLLEAVTRYVCAFSAQSEKGAEQAMRIEFLEDEPVVRREPPATPKKEIVLPPGVKLDKEPAVLKEWGHQRFDDQLPDDSERKVTPDVPAEDKNKPGSFDRLMSTFGAAGAR